MTSSYTQTSVPALLLLTLWDITPKQMDFSGSWWEGQWVSAQLRRFQKPAPAQEWGRESSQKIKRVSSKGRDCNSKGVSQMCEWTHEASKCLWKWLALNWGTLIHQRSGSEAAFPSTKTCLLLCLCWKVLDFWNRNKNSVQYWTKNTFTLFFPVKNSAQVF